MIRAICIALLALGMSTTARADIDRAWWNRDATKDRCNVFDASFCLAMPHGLQVAQREGPDFTVYTFKTYDEDARFLFAVFVGMHPDEVEADARLLHRFRNGGTRVEMYAKPDDAVDVRVMFEGGWTTLHFFGANDADGRAALASTLSTLRGCAMRDYTVRCKKRPLFDAAAIEHIRQRDAPTAP